MICYQLLVGHFWRGCRVSWAAKRKTWAISVLHIGVLGSEDPLIVKGGYQLLIRPLPADPHYHQGRVVGKRPINIGDNLLCNSPPCWGHKGLSHGSGGGWGACSHPPPLFWPKRPGMDFDGDPKPFSFGMGSPFKIHTRYKLVVTPTRFFIFIFNGSSFSLL